jgi:hypothetical protein
LVPQKISVSTATGWRAIAAVVTAAAIGSVIALAPSPAAAADVGVSISISEPGVYGRVDIGRFPRPEVYVAQPVIVSPPRVVVVRPEPVYLWVPPGHRRHWSRYCGQYRACASPVVFVRDEWYDARVRPHRVHRRDDRYDRRDDRWDDRRGHPGRGRGHDRDDHDRGRPGRGHDHRH